MSRRVAAPALRTTAVLLVLAALAAAVTVAAASNPNPDPAANIPAGAMDPHHGLLMWHGSPGHAAARAHAVAATRDFFALQGATSTSSNSSTSNPACAVSAIAASPELAAVNASCGTDLAASVRAVFNFTETNATSTALVSRFCSSACQSAYSAYVAAYAACYPAQARVAALTARMCQRYDGQYCALRLRVTTRASQACEALSSPSACTADSQCEFTAATSFTPAKCESVPTPPLLQEFCTPCMTMYMDLFPRIVRASYGPPDTPAAALAGAADADVAVWLAGMRGGVEAICARVGDTWCFPVYNAVGAGVILGSSATLTMDQLIGNVSATCTPTGATCVNKVVNAIALSYEAQTEWAYIGCRSSGGACTGITCRPEQHAAICSTQLFVGLRFAARMRASAQFFCAKGAAPNGEGWCAVAVEKYRRDPCASSFVTCNATCAARLATLSTDLGCCGTRHAATESTYVDVERAPASARPYLNAQFSTDRDAPSNLTAFDLARCEQAVAGFNATAAIAASRATCNRSAPVQRDLPLAGLRWAAVSGNATLRARLEAALRSDVATAAGAALADVSGALLEDAARAVTAARRQAATTTTSSGVTYRFSIVADTAAAAQLGASAFDSAQAGGTLRVSAAAAVVAECADCVGSPTAAPGQTAAPPPTGNFGAALAGAPADGSLSISGAAASPSGVAVTLLVAVVAAAMALAA